MRIRLYFNHLFSYYLYCIKYRRDQHPVNSDFIDTYKTDVKKQLQADTIHSVVHL